MVGVKGKLFRPAGSFNGKWLATLNDERPFVGRSHGSYHVQISEAVGLNSVDASLVPINAAASAKTGMWASLQSRRVPMKWRGDDPCRQSPSGGPSTWRVDNASRDPLCYDANHLQTASHLPNAFANSSFAIGLERKSSIPAS